MRDNSERVFTMTTMRLRHHADLMDRMATTLGIDLEEKTLRGEMPFSEISEAVLRCTGCTGAGECEGWLQDHTAGSDQTPQYCRNSDLFKTLR